HPARGFGPHRPNRLLRHRAEILAIAVVPAGRTLTAAPERQPVLSSQPQLSKLGSQFPHRAVFALCATELGRVRCPPFRVSETAGPKPAHSDRKSTRLNSSH